MNYKDETLKSTREESVEYRWIALVWQSAVALTSGLGRNSADDRRARSVTDLTALDQLRNELARRRVVVVAGAGVSAAVADLPRWRAAVELAIRHLASVGTVTSARLQELRGQLAAAQTSQDLVECAAAVRDALTGASSSAGEFASWLQDLFDVNMEDIKDPRLLRAIHSIGSPLLATTNYDKLLSISNARLQPVTSQDPAQLTHALRTGGRVVHLHGVWDDPESVVFGLADYEQIANLAQHQAFMQTIWLDRTIMFVGCSLDGMRDPDFTRLLDWAAETFPNSTVTHYALVKSGSYTPAQADEFLNRWRIQLVPYGSSHEDLVPFIGQLTPPVVAARPVSPPPAFTGRTALADQLIGVFSSGRSAIVHGMGGIGKTSVIAKAVAEWESDDPSCRTVWLSARAKSADDLCRELGLALGSNDAKTLPSETLRGQLPGLLLTAGRIGVVLDDADRLGEAQTFTQELTSLGTPVVVSSRTRSARFDESLEVGPLEPEEAIDLFSSISGVSLKNPRIAIACASLGGHPLAIEIAAAKLAVEGLPIDRLIARLSDETSKLSTLRDQSVEESPSSSVRASLQVSLDGLPEDLVVTMAILAQFPANPGLELLSKAIGISIVETEDRIGLLVARSLVQWSEDNRPRLHQLIRNHVRQAYQAQAER